MELSSLFGRVAPNQRSNITLKCVLILKKSERFICNIVFLVLLISIIFNTHQLSFQLQRLGWTANNTSWNGWSNCDWTTATKWKQPHSTKQIRNSFTFTYFLCFNHEESCIRSIRLISIFIFLYRLWYQPNWMKGTMLTTIKNCNQVLS